MWQVLKAELRYSAPLVSILLAILIPVLIIFALFGGEEIEKSQPAVLVLLWAVAVILIVFSLLMGSKIKKDRWLSLLPLPLRTIGLVRLYFVTVVWTVLFISFWAIHLIFHFHILQMETLWRMLSLTGIVLSVNALYVLSRDLPFKIRRKSRILFFHNDEYPSIIITLMLILVFTFPVGVDVLGLSKNTQTALLSFYSSWPGALILNQCWLALYGLSIYIFTHRRTYVA
ncbi:hypothetical protein ACFLT9_01215 [Acidobacteriota bacterium]